MAERERRTILIESVLSGRRTDGSKMFVRTDGRRTDGPIRMRLGRRLYHCAPKKLCQKHRGQINSSIRPVSRKYPRKDGCPKQDEYVQGLYPSCTDAGRTEMSDIVPENHHILDTCVKFVWPLYTNLLYLCTLHARTSICGTEDRKRTEPCCRRVRPGRTTDGREGERCEKCIDGET